MSRVFRASVGHLAAFVHRSGDLGDDGAPRVRALEGIRRQQAHQAGRGKRYRREATLRGSWRAHGLRLELAGRADGVLLDAENRIVAVEEIKTFRGELAAVRTRAGRVHDAQARLYAALVCAADEEAPAPAVRLVYVDADSEAVEVLETRPDRATLRAFLEDSCRRYAEWLAEEARWRDARDAALGDLAFPMPAFRPGQRRLAREVWRALRDGRPLLAEAPTGIGKTLGVLYAALRRLPEGPFERVLWLTMRGSARHLALEAAERVRAAGVPLRAIELLAREKMCLTPGAPCAARACPYAAGYHDRARDALRALLGTRDRAPAILDAERVRAVAEAHRVCPAALQHEAARFCDLVVGDANYGFDPFAGQRGLLDAEEGGAAVLVDEGHHLAERVRDMHSGQLDAVALRGWLAEGRAAGCGWARSLERVHRRLRATDAGERVPEVLVNAVETLVGELSAWLQEAPAGALVPRVQRLLGELLRFLEAAGLATGPDGAAWRLLREDGPAGPVLRLRCLAAGPRLGALVGELAGFVLFSATLAPLAQTRALLGLPDDTTLLRLPCPFPPERRGVLLVPGLDLRHAGREAALPALTALLVGLARARPGHHLVFAPSFAFAARLGETLAQRLPEAEVPVQSPAMDEAARRAFLDALARPDGRTRVACAVAGGLFGEAIDLPGECLVGVVVAGLPLPAPDVERRAVQDYHGADGFDVAFRFPAMTRVLQAAGRLIRGEGDAGVVCLVDRRFAQPAWRELLPPEWTPERCTPAEAPRLAASFWARVAGPPSPATPAEPADVLEP